ncbi:MAG: hypothetical protein J6I84_04980 [Bacilli bacterium]|nr:hypothetical protein [Bacilli bacterium]
MDITIYEDATWGKIGKDIVPAPLYQVYRISGVWTGDDESLWYSFEPGNDLEASEIKIVDLEDPEKTYDVIEVNKYGLTEDKEVVKVTITASAGLKAQYPEAIVNVDGKLHDIAFLDSPIEFYMDKNHRVSIEWADGLKETFRVIKKA